MSNFRCVPQVRYYVCTKIDTNTDTNVCLVSVSIDTWKTLLSYLKGQRCYVLMSSLVEKLKKYPQLSVEIERICSQLCTAEIEFGECLHGDEYGE